MKTLFKCILCRKKIENIEKLETHFKSHSLTEKHRFYCHLCEIKFLKFSSLKNHLNFKHLNKRKSKSLKISRELDDIINEAHSFAQEDSDFDGFDHNDSFNNAEPLQQQKLFKCTVSGCPKTFQQDTLFAKNRNCGHSNILKNYCCQFCSKSFKTLSVLNVHIKMHMNQRDHNCDNCEKSFFTSSHLKAHSKIHMKEVYSYKCSVLECGKTFIHLSSFKKHQNFHQGIKNNQCSICKRSFSQRCHLTQHLKTHSDERKYVCFCKKGFKRPDTLRVHQKVHL
jgi:Zinc finger, C2H2 type